MFFLTLLTRHINPMTVATNQYYKGYLIYLFQDGSIDFSQNPLPLRLELVHSLCIAEQLGVLESIKHIAKEIHERDQPPTPPPYVSYPRPRQHIVKTSSTESTSQETICSRNLCTPWDGKERLHSQATMIVPDDTFIHREASKEENLKDSTSIAAKVKHCSDDEEESHDTKPSPVNEGSTTTSLCVEAIDVAVGSSSLEREGLRRRRKEKTIELSRKTKDSRTEAVANNNRSRKFMYYGIGAGTFLYKI